MSSCEQMFAIKFRSRDDRSGLKNELELELEVG